MPKIANRAAKPPPTPLPIKQTSLPVVREYEIGGVKYIVTAAVRDGASEDAAAKVRRLIRRELDAEKEKLHMIDF